MNKKGFTVVEIVIVLAIFGAVIVMVATIGPTIAQKSRLNRAANELISDLNLAKQTASSEYRYVAVDFSDDGRSYTIRKRSYNYGDFDPDPGKLDQESEWTVMKTAKPLDGDPFFQDDGVTDFAFSATGLVRVFDSSNPDPTQITLTIFIKKKRYAGNIDFTKKIKIYPYGGIRVEE